jgi:hypothetical protein
VATEIDLPWTYVAGPAGLIGQLIADDRIEALPAAPADPLTRVENWVAAWAEEAAAGLLQSGEAVITTSRGTVQSWLDRPVRGQPTELRTRSVGDNGVMSGGGQPLSRAADYEALRLEIASRLARAIIELVGV